jgi:hypothetical protein
MVSRIAAPGSAWTTTTSDGFKARCERVKAEWPVERFLTQTDFELDGRERAEIRDIHDWRKLIPGCIRRFGRARELSHAYCFGAAHGDTARQLVEGFRYHGMRPPHLYLFDSFDGLPDEVPNVPVPQVWKKGAFRRSEASLRERLAGAEID